MGRGDVEREWLITDGLGGYASGTVGGANTRRHHGLLVAALEPPTDRMVFVAKIEERLLVDGSYKDLSFNHYPSVDYPKGTQYLWDFKPKPLPKWEFCGPQWQLEKQIGMVQGSNTVVVRYANMGTSPYTLELHPLYTYVDYQSNFHQQPWFDFYTEFSADHLKTYAHYGASPVFTKWSSGDYTENRAWYRNIQLPKEKDRGLDSDCDYYRIGYLAKELNPNESILLAFSTDESLLRENLGRLWSQVEHELEPKAETDPSFFDDLIRSGDQFLVVRQSTQSESIIAGYHWFTDWGRDTMISMRGLTIATGRQSVSDSILRTFFKSIDQGMLPDRFPDSGGNVEYNTIDATLWLFVASYDYYKKFKDLLFVKDHLEIFRDILDWHIKGTRYNIHVTPEGFLYGGQEGEQLTWMDARVDGQVVTPRIGCPVEVNALWYNALKIYEFFCRELQAEFERTYLDILHAFELHFHDHFVNEEGTLYDVIVPKGDKDNSFRPNQLFWLSLPFTLLDKDRQLLIFEKTQERLYTPYGLRSLAPNDPKFIGSYQGNQWSRDHAYHQGTVWPFLLYDYYHAFLTLYGDTTANRLKVISALSELRTHFYGDGGLHCISEVFDGMHPVEGKGCIHQAWSVGAIIKLYHDHGLHGK
ncbi:amylo-alpha-1,6-glucosidase [Flagellimonas beolgyonensis]|uniref:amylo-alpha-1,6-glucosidase n=1 Tax=Flagellimonas beolgyonensis TaxID=864064 RepID=UPI003D65CDA9